MAKKNVVASALLGTGLVAGLGYAVPAMAVGSQADDDGLSTAATPTTVATASSSPESTVAASPSASGSASVSPSPSRSASPSPSASCRSVAGPSTAVARPGDGAAVVTIQVCGTTVTSVKGAVPGGTWSVNPQALPALDKLALQYYKTDITKIHYSRATLTSNAYQTSLKGALKTAGI